MIPAIAGDATEVPPTACAEASVALLKVQGVLCESQMTYAVFNAPLDAKRERSGTSRLPSAGTPVPVCQDGLAYPPAQLATVLEVGVVQALLPPVPPTALTRKSRLLSPGSVRISSQTPSSSRPPPIAPISVSTSKLAHVPFHGTSG